MAARSSSRHRRPRCSRTTPSAPDARRASTQGSVRPDPPPPAPDRRAPRRVPAAEDAVPLQPARPGHSVSRPRGRACRGRRASARPGHPPAHTHRPRRNRQDTARPAGRRRGRRPLSRRHLLGRARPAARFVTRPARRSRMRWSSASSRARHRSSRREALSGQAALLVLDNAEHLLPGACGRRRAARRAARRSGSSSRVASGSSFEARQAGRSRPRAGHGGALR